MSGLDDAMASVVRLSNLGAALWSRFERTGNLADVDEAITVGCEAVAATPPDHPVRAAALANLGVWLRGRFVSTGNLADLDEAITVGREAVAAMAMVPSPYRIQLLDCLSGSLAIRFQRTGNLADLSDAITASRSAADAVLPGDPDRFRYLSGLGAVLQVRFLQEGQLADLEDAVAVCREAAASVPPGHLDRAVLQSNLAVALESLFRRTGRRADLDDAVAASLAAVAATERGDPRRAARLANLSGALRIRFDVTGDMADLDRAIAASSGAVAESRAGRADELVNLSALSASLRTRFTRTGNLADLNNAIAVGYKAAAAAPTGHPHRASVLLDLCIALQTRSTRGGGLPDLDDAIVNGREAHTVMVAPPGIRAAAGLMWGRAAALRGRWNEAVGGYSAAVDLLSLAVPRSLARGDQEYMLNELRGLAPDAAASAVRAGLADRAVELFEQSRGVMIAQALDARTDLTALSEQYPALASRFTQARDALNSTEGDDSHPLGLPAGVQEGGAEGRVSQSQQAQRRRAAAELLDQVTAEIRQVQGFRNFLRPHAVADLAAVSAEGSIVLVNVSQFGSHALILTGGAMLDPIPLPDLTADTASYQVAAFLAALSLIFEPKVGPDGRRAMEEKLSDTLEWLWDAVAGPVLDELEITGPPEGGKPWPRLWWCVSGLLAFLPLHAAGRRDTTTSATAIDRVVSSYTPTIRALAHARRVGRLSARGRVNASASSKEVLVVAMPHTPGAAGLPGAQAEAEALQSRFPGDVHVLAGPRATRAAVLAALPSAWQAHFACHGYSDMTDPSASRLLLADQSLTVMDVARLRLDADLVFLSACSTATASSKLTDEAIHLASAFQLAGFRHVIATLWPIGDRRAVDISTDIYTDVAAGIDPARALHGVTRKLRRQCPETPSAWASHIHYGA